MIHLVNVTKVFNPGTPREKTVIRNLNLEVATGEVVTVIGSNGAGKTTLLSLISGAILPTAGEILIKGVPVTREPEYRRARHIGRIFQDPLAGTASNMTLEDNLMITAKKGFKWPKISLNAGMRASFRDEVSQLGMGLDSRMKENVSSLSGGQRQALTLLMTVRSDPDILLLDEHTAALDPGNAARVMDLTLRFVRARNLTTLMVTHNMGHAIEFGNRLDQGEVIIDVGNEAKKQLTRQRLIDMFSGIRKQELDNDELLLTP
jgi:putative ABC transport system ATP-binding protein